MQAIYLVIFLFILFFSVIVHEFCHGYVAYLNGDDTARLLGRLTFNPIPHIDPVGTVLLPLILIVASVFTGGRLFIIGWAKPVPINPLNFRDHDRGMLTVGLAGPASNIILGTILALLSKNFTAGIVKDVFFFGGIINFVLAFFNLIPIPPLDGSRILGVFLPGNIRYRYEQLERYGFMLVFAFLFLGGFGLIYPMAYKIASTLAGS
ncbi:MAG: site-2 protease family protein [Candidatus Omnitrophica bacterium]|nr:site-2 protease family protein [Candidatus Omnitrophota bacterium]